MSYLKLYKVITDLGLGLQYVNQLGANIDAVAAGLAAQHGTNYPAATGTASAPYDFNALGRHNGGGVPRCTLYSNGPQLSSFTAVIPWQSNPIVTNVFRWSTGQYLFSIAQLGAFWGHAVALQGSVSTVRIPPRCWAQTSTGSGGVGLWVNTYDLVAGAFALADTPFALTIYGPAN